MAKYGALEVQLHVFLDGEGSHPDLFNYTPIASPRLKLEPNPEKSVVQPVVHRYTD
jgi:hypothetical protein